jgi:hypothetical protein
MITSSRKQALRNAVQEWKDRHQIADDDPLLATVELWEAFLDSVKMPEAGLSGYDLRRELEQFDRFGKAFAKQSSDVIRELRSVPKLKEDLWMFPYFTVMVIAIGALITGMLVGKFLL